MVLLGKKNTGERWLEVGSADVSGNPKTISVNVCHVFVIDCFEKVCDNFDNM